jgi:hypothetical protein
MKRYCAFFCLAFACAATARDPNQPVSRGSAEFSAGASYARLTGGFDGDGKYAKYPDSVAPAALGTPLRIRWGLGNGFELRTDWSYVATNEDYGSREGFSQPIVGLRYYIGKYTGVFNLVTLPFATGDLDNGDLHTLVEIGGSLRMRSEKFRVIGLASYIDDFDESEILRLYARPEILWTKGFSNFLTGELLYGLGQGAWLASVGPGARADFTESVAAELTTPFSVAGRNSPIAGWSVSLRGIWNLKY